VFMSHVEDSDYALVSVAGPDGITSNLLFNASVARDLRDGAWAAEVCEHQVTSGDWRGWASDRLAAWSRSAPNPVDAPFVLELLKQEWTFADEPAGELIDRRGLPTTEPPPDPAFEGAVSLDMDQGTSIIEGIPYDIKTARYVMGRGRDFVGIWDRQHPGPPIRRFAKGATLPAIAELASLIRGQT
jgi:hypothetical protein